MTDPRKDIEGLQREMDETRADVQKVQKGETTTQQKNQSIDAVIIGAGMLLVLDLAVGFASQVIKQQTAMFASAASELCGLVLGYAVGRRKKG